ncbi:MAG: outer membrane protein [Candidatus Zixiibacteriota bacterium]
MTKRIFSGILLSFLLAFPIIAKAQVGISFGPHVGIQKAQDADESNYLFGGTVRAKFAALGAEGSISYRQEDYESGAVTVKSWPVTASGLIYPLPVIYGAVGGGWYNTTFDFNESYNMAGFDDRTEQEFGWHMGAGLEIPLTPKTKLFGDVRWVFLEYQLENLPTAVVEDVNADFYSINAGILFQL